MRKLFPFSVKTFSVVWRRKIKIQKLLHQNFYDIMRRFFFFKLQCLVLLPIFLPYLFKLCKHKEGENPQERALEGIKNISCVNLSLSDDTFDTFSSSLCFSCFSLFLDSHPLETHAPSPKTFVTFFFSFCNICFLCVFSPALCSWTDIHLKAVVKQCFMALQNMFIVSTKRIMNCLVTICFFLLSAFWGCTNRSRWPLIKIYFYRFNLGLYSLPAHAHSSHTQTGIVYTSRLRRLFFSIDLSSLQHCYSWNKDMKLLKTVELWTLNDAHSRKEMKWNCLIELWLLL